MLTSFGKKVEVFLFYLVKCCLKGILDRTVRLCSLTGNEKICAKNEGNGGKKRDMILSNGRFFRFFFVFTTCILKLPRQDGIVNLYDNFTFLLAYILFLATTFRLFQLKSFSLQFFFHNVKKSFLRYHSF